MHEVGIVAVGRFRRLTSLAVISVFCGNILLLSCSAATAWAHPQGTPAASRTPNVHDSLDEAGPMFRSNVDLVRLLVSVHDQRGAPITDLTRSDFAVLDNLAPQTISVFERNTSLPLSVAVLIDTSGSTQIDLHYEVESVNRFVPTLLKAGNPEDAFALFSFNWRTNLECDYSRNGKRAEHALHTLHGEGGTSLYDAIYLASDTLINRSGRHVIVIVTDGGDTTSYKRFDDALEAAQRSDVVLYPIVVIPMAGDAGRNVGGEHALETLASSTGGRIFYPQGFDRLDAALAEILRELRTQYLLGFYPANVASKRRSYHRVSIELKQPQFKATARSGYYEP